MKRIFTAMVAGVMLLSTTTTHAQQVGVNTNDPKATFQVVGQPTVTTVPDGMIPPKITRAELTAKNAIYTADQTGTMVYVTTLDGTATGKTVNVTSLGLYYFDGTVWVSLKGEQPLVTGINYYNGRNAWAAAGTLIITDYPLLATMDATYVQPAADNKSITLKNGIYIVEWDCGFETTGYTYMNLSIDGSGYSRGAVGGWGIEAWGNASAGGSTNWTGSGYRQTVINALGSDRVIRFDGRVGVSTVKISRLSATSAGYVIFPSSGGTAEVNTYFGTSACTGTTGAINGLAVVGKPSTGHTMTLYASVSVPGTYSISTNTVNGVTFSGSGTFSATGCQLVTLTASGSYTSVGSFTWTTNTFPSISATKDVRCDTVLTAIVSITRPSGKKWMDRNLGATQAATSATDAAAYGYLFQWGRGDDGHQCRNSATTNVMAGADQPGHSMFIYNPNVPRDWRNPQNNMLWQGVGGINNPCPSGWRLPTDAELTVEIPNGTTGTGAYSSPLKFTTGGCRWPDNANVQSVGVEGYYWTSTPNNFGSGWGSAQKRFSNAIGGGATTWTGTARAMGASVRCMQD